MSIIIGSNTNVSIGGTSTGYIQAQWSIQVQNARQWKLGSWDPYVTVVTKIISVSITSYAGVVGSQSIPPSTSCANANTIGVVISPQSCGGSVVGINENMFVSGYNYNKGDPVGFGQESWQFQEWVDAGVSSSSFISIPAPTYTIRGRAEGTTTGNMTASEVGIVFNTSGAPLVTGSQGSVQAGFGATGTADTVTYGLVSTVGGGLLQGAGKIGQSQAQIPYQPLYV